MNLIAMNLPNFITTLRILLIPFFIIAVLYGYHLYALGIFIAAALTDALDGFIARTFNMQTKLGTYLDPIADKLLLMSSIVVMAVVGKAPVWLVILIVSRDIIILIGCILIYFLYDQLTVRPSILGKATTFFQIVLVLLVLVAQDMERFIPWIAPAVWLTAAVTIASGLHYVNIGFRMAGSLSRRQNDQKDR